MYDETYTIVDFIYKNDKLEMIYNIIYIYIYS